MKTYPQDIQATEPCQARELLVTATGSEPRPCPTPAVARYEGHCYCAWHMEELGWVRTGGDAVSGAGSGEPDGTTLTTKENADALCCPESLDL
jgi:hypothetical protein